MTNKPTLAGLIWAVALQIPAIRRIVAQRDTLLKDMERIVAERNWLDRDSARSREALRRAKLPERAVPSTPQTPKVAGLCEVTNPARYFDEEWLALHNDLDRYAVDKHCFKNFSGAVHRKGWEWTHCLYGLRQLGMLKPEHRAVGIGAGREPVIYYLADHIAHVTATDLYGEAAWSSGGGKESDLALIEESKKFCPSSVDFSKITFENQDGTNLLFADNSFDFAWSLSSIEHFGGHGAARQAIQEMGRVVRPGGIVAVATEMLMLEEHSHPDYFTRSEIATELVKPCTKLELAGDINFDTLTFEYLVDSICMPYLDRERRHVVLNDGNVQWTSILLFFRKLV